jgi:putative Holliday junction resolvase
MIILAIDYGDKRVGVAKSDSMCFLATGLDTIVRKDRKYESVAKEIQKIVEHYKVDRVVVGMPKNMNGTFGERARKTEDFVKVLEKYINTDIIFWDERLTSKSAHITMHEQGIKTGHNKGRVDKIAACIILQSYLDSI